MITKISNKKEYISISKEIQAIIKKGTSLGDMELLDDADKKEYIRLSDMIIDWEKVYYPTPVNPLVKKNVLSLNHSKMMQECPKKNAQ